MCICDTLAHHLLLTSLFGHLLHRTTCKSRQVPHPPELQSMLWPVDRLHPSNSAPEVKGVQGIKLAKWEQEYHLFHQAFMSELSCCLLAHQDELKCCLAQALNTTKGLTFSPASSLTTGGGEYQPISLGWSWVLTPMLLVLSPETAANTEDHYTQSLTMIRENALGMHMTTSGSSSSVLTTSTGSNPCLSSFMTCPSLLRSSLPRDIVPLLPIPGRHMEAGGRHVGSWSNEGHKCMMIGRG